MTYKIGLEGKIFWMRGPERGQRPCAYEARAPGGGAQTENCKRHLILSSSAQQAGRAAPEGDAGTCCRPGVRAERREMFLTDPSRKEKGMEKGQEISQDLFPRNRVT